MCGRFALSKGDRIDWAQFGVRRAHTLPPRYNVSPGQTITVVRAGDDGPVVATLRWGLVPSWARDPSIGNRLANARLETAPEKPSFRAAFRHRRCLVLADGFYEWQVVPGEKRKQPWFIQRKDETIFAFAGLWERWVPRTASGGADENAAPLETCTLLTTEPNALMAPIHDRMPVIIAPNDYAAWISPDATPQDVQALTRAWSPNAWTAYRVSRRVNTTAHDDAACIAPSDGDA